MKTSERIAIETCDRANGAHRREAIDHPARKVRYDVLRLDTVIGECEAKIEALIASLRETSTDPATWDEVIELRRALRSVSHQIVHVIEANSEWADRAAHAGCAHSQETPSCEAVPDAR